MLISGSTLLLAGLLTACSTSTPKELPKGAHAGSGLSAQGTSGADVTTVGPPLPSAAPQAAGSSQAAPAPARPSVAFPASAYGQAPSQPAATSSLSPAVMLPSSAPSPQPAAPALPPPVINTVVAVHSGKAVDFASTSAGSTPQQMTVSGGKSQQLSFQQLSNGHYQIKSVASGLCLDLGAPDPAQTIVQNPCANASAEQEWLLTASGTGMSITNVGSSACMDVYGTAVTDGAAVVTWTCNSQTNQQWRITPVSP